MLSLSSLGCVFRGVGIGLTESLFLLLVICFIILHALTFFTRIWDPSLHPQRLLWSVTVISTVSCLNFVQVFENSCLSFVGMQEPRASQFQGDLCTDWPRQPKGAHGSHAARIASQVERRGFGMLLKLGPLLMSCA